MKMQEENLNGKWDVDIVKITSRRRQRSKREKNYNGDLVGGSNLDVIIQLI